MLFKPPTEWRPVMQPSEMGVLPLWCVSPTHQAGAHTGVYAHTGVCTCTVIQVCAHTHVTGTVVHAFIHTCIVECNA